MTAAGLQRPSHPVMLVPKQAIEEAAAAAARAEAAAALAEADEDARAGAGASLGERHTCTTPEQLQRRVLQGTLGACCHPVQQFTSLSARTKNGMLPTVLLSPECNDVRLGNQCTPAF